MKLQGSNWLINTPEVESSAAFRFPRCPENPQFRTIKKQNKAFAQKVPPASEPALQPKANGRFLFVVGKCSYSSSWYARKRIDIR